MADRGLRRLPRSIRGDDAIPKDERILRAEAEMDPRHERLERDRRPDTLLVENGEAVAALIVALHLAAGPYRGLAALRRRLEEERRQEGRALLRILAHRDPLLDGPRLVLGVIEQLEW